MRSRTCCHGTCVRRGWIGAAAQRREWRRPSELRSCSARHRGSFEVTPALPGRSRPAPRGFSLLELIVVMIVLSLAAGIALPALGRRTEPRGGELPSLILLSQEAAARRGETIHLEIAGSGAWTIQGSASRGDGPIRAGQVDSFPGLPLTLI